MGYGCAYYIAAQERPFWKGLADGYHGAQRQMGLKISQKTCCLSRILRINRYLLNVWGRGSKMNVALKILPYKCPL